MESASGSRVNLPHTMQKYTICGLDTPVARAVANLLGVFGCEKAEKVGDASIAILDHLGNFSLSQEVLRFYHDSLGGRTKRLIYLESGSAKGPIVQEIWRPDASSWFSPIANTSTIIPLIATWSDVPLVARSSCTTPPEPKVCRALIAEVLQPVRGSEKTEFPWATFTTKWPTLLRDDAAGFYYSLLCISENHLDRSHQEKQIFDRDLFSVLPAGGGAAQFCELLQEKRFRETVEDLRTSLASRVLPPSDGLNCILLVDDDPDYLGALRSIQRVFFPDYEVWLCRLNEDQKEVIQLLAQYRSTDRSADYVQRKLSLERACPDGGTEGDQTTLADVFRRMRFVLMDQVFRTSGGWGELLGPTLTRGLLRILRDLVDDVKDKTNRRPPELVALSRTEDPEVIQSALRAGARDYVVKSRLLSLPSVLAKLQRAVTDSPHHLHRNFRALSRLPNETTGLLQTIRIPRIALHHPPHKPDGKEGQVRSRLPIPGAQEIAELLTALPKPDLHVHVGSCMSAQFLVVASLVSLLRHQWSAAFSANLDHLVALLHRLRSSQTAATLTLIEALSPNPVPTPKPEPARADASWIVKLAHHTNHHLTHQLDAQASDKISVFRAILHKELGIPDFFDKAAAQEKLRSKPSLDLALFAIRNSQDIKAAWKQDDIIRVYLLTLATMYRDKAGVRPSLHFGSTRASVDFLRLFTLEKSVQPIVDWSSAWREANQLFYSDTKTGVTVKRFKDVGWHWDTEFTQSLKQLALEWPESPDADDCSQLGFDPNANPIEYELATGLHSTSLVEYLQGCEFSGAEHLRHPFLIHLYAQQTVMEFVRKGVFYAEMKGSPDGFVNPDERFEFSGVCGCLVEAFTQAQEAILLVYRTLLRSENRLDQAGEDDPNWIGGVLGKRFSHSNLRAMFAREVDPLSGRSFLRKRLPCKVSLVFVGKRHKSTREMILEAAATAVMRPSGERPITSAKEFVENEMGRCRVVGFDLAGREFDNPPDLFAEEFSRLSRLHIPITIHAGENAPARFIEDALLLLQAKRIGHGLALAEDRGLMTRVREDRVCIELCPVCNHQTSHFVPADSDSPGRRYPLKDYLEHGIYVTVNTDNPIISNTNLVREYFQASYSYDKNGLSIWDALRIMRMGYVCSFLHLPERRAMIAVVEQFIFDLFCREDVVGLLRELAELQRACQAPPASN